jgi:AraC-like DNA-binding protein
MLRQAIEYINTHLGKNLSLKAMADELHISQYHFCRLFKRMGVCLDSPTLTEVSLQQFRQM